jgi:hypothetical protein
MRADRDLACRGHQQRVAVGRGDRGRLRADHAVGARLVLDHERLAEQRTDMLAQMAGEDIDPASGGVRHDHPDRPRGIRFLCEGTAGGSCEAGQDDMASSDHGSFIARWETWTRGRMQAS